jgi:hypothetical protein
MARGTHIMGILCGLSSFEVSRVDKNGMEVVFFISFLVIVYSDDFIYIYIYIYICVDLNIKPLILCY